MFTRAIKGKGLSVIYIEDKKRWVKKGGNRTWRNNNPGNIKSGAHSRIQGSIGSVGGFAVFPSYEAGLQALVWLLKKKVYQNKTVFDMVSSFAPKNDHNDPDQYRKLIREKTGLNINKKIKDLTEEEFNSLVSAIQKIEGNKTGTEETFYAKSIVDIQVDDKNIIVAYLIEDMGWKSKPEVISLIEEGRVDAVIVNEKGSVYIRTRPDEEVYNNLEEKKPRKK
jgi:ribosomal protein S13